MKNEQTVSTYIPIVHWIAAGSRSRMQVRSERPAGIDCWHLTYTLDGTVYYPCGESGFTSGRDMLTLVRPGHPLLYRNTPARRTWSWMFAIFRPHPHWTSLLQWPEMAPGYMQLDLSDLPIRKEVLSLFRRILNHVHTGSSHYQEQLAMNELERLLLELNPVLSRGDKEMPDPRMLKLERFVDERLDGELSVGTLAEACGLSDSRLAHWFREATESTPMQFVEERRMERARNLLTSTDDPVKVVGLQSGYPDPQHFTKRFRQLHGMSPGQFRKGSARLEM